MLTYEETDSDHVLHVASHMREADRVEVYASGRKTPLEALSLGFATSDQCITALTPCGEPVAIFGIAPRCRLTGVGIPWLLGTDEVLRYWREFLIAPRKVLPVMLEMYSSLENYVHIDNRLSVRWLQRIGFIMDAPVQFPSGHWFRRFHMQKEC